MGQELSHIEYMADNTTLVEFLTPSEMMCLVFVTKTTCQRFHPCQQPSDSSTFASSTRPLRRRIDTDTRRLFNTQDVADVEDIIHQMNGTTEFAVCLAGGGALDVLMGGSISADSRGTLKGDLDFFVDTRASAQTLVTKMLETGRYVVSAEHTEVRLRLDPRDWNPAQPWDAEGGMDLPPKIMVENGLGGFENRRPLDLSTNHTIGHSNVAHIEIGVKLLQLQTSLLDGLSDCTSGGSFMCTIAGTDKTVRVKQRAIDVILLKNPLAVVEGAAAGRAKPEWTSNVASSSAGRGLWSFDFSVCAAAIIPRQEAATTDFHITDVESTVYRQLRFSKTRSFPGRMYSRSNLGYIALTIHRESQWINSAGKHGNPCFRVWNKAILNLVDMNLDSRMCEPPSARLDNLTCCFETTQNIQAEIDILIAHYDTFLQYLVDTTGVGSQPAIVRHREGDTLAVLGLIAVTGRLLLLPTQRRLSYCSQSRRLLQVLSSQLLRAHKYEQRSYGTANLPPVFSINGHLDRAGVPRQKKGDAHRTGGLRDNLIAWMGEHAWTRATIYDAWQMFELDGASWMGDGCLSDDTRRWYDKYAVEKQAFLACPLRRALLEASYHRNAGDVDGGEGKSRDARVENI